jgi:phage terminase small subunit
MKVIDGGQQIVEEPDWEQTYSDTLDVGFARTEWRLLVAALTEAGTLAPENARQMQRCVDFRIAYEKALRQVAEKGIVIPPKRGSKTAIARPSPYWHAMREAAADLDRIEGELGLPPRRRGSVTKVDRKQRARQAADAYLRPVGLR